MIKDALDYLRDLEAPVVAFVGPISRTWTEDVVVLATIMEMMWEAREYGVVHLKPTGFDLNVATYATALGLFAEEVEPSGRDAVGRAIRDVAMLDGVSMLVAFPEEPGLHVEASRAKRFRVEMPSWKTADPLICDAAEKLHLPVLVVRRDGSTEWMT